MAAKLREKLAGAPAFARRRPLLASAVAVAVVMLAAMAVFGPRFVTSDDRAINNVLQGVIAEGSPFAMYINYLLAQGLLWLYQATPGLNLNWFTLYQVAVLYAAFVAIGWVLLRAGKGQAGLWAWALFNLSVVSLFSVELQYNLTTCAGCFAGMLLMAHALAGEAKLPAYLPGAALALLSGLLRFKCFWMVLPFAGLLGALALFPAGRPVSLKGLWARARRGLAVAAALVVLLVAADAASRAVYESRYPGILARNSQREQLIDYSKNDYEQIAEGLGALDISENSYDLLLDWVHADPPVYGTGVWGEIKALQMQPSLYFGAVRLVTEYREMLLAQPLYPVGLALAAGLLLLAARRRARWPQVAGPLLLVASFHAIMYFFCVLGRLTVPVINGCLFALVGALLYCLAALPEPREKEGALSWLAALCVLCVPPLLHLGGLLFTPAVDPAPRALVAELTAREGEVFLVQSDLEIWRAYGVFERSDPRSNLVSLGGWGTMSPAAAEQYQRLGIASPMRELDGENTYVLADDDAMMERLVLYFEEHTGKAATFRLEQTLGGQKIYKVTR